MIEIIIFLIIGIAIGAIISYLVEHNKMVTAQSKLSAEITMLEKQIEINKKTAEETLNTQIKHAEELRNEIEKQNEEKNKLIQEEIKTMASDLFKQNRKEMNDIDKERLDSLLSPLKERLESFNQTVNNSNKENAQNKTEIKSAFEEAMKRLHDEQINTVKSIREDNQRNIDELKLQTQRIENEASSLTSALKGDSKIQGDWGEMILSKTLEDCGLIKDQQYFLQQNYKDKNGNNYRPDAVIEFPNKDKAVIDAKVSLTAYQESIKASSNEERQQLLNEHVKSIKKHVDELSDKNYESLVPGCIGYILMFIPYESGYSAAIKTDANILQYAYKKHIIILSPSNLLMALQLTHTMWQNYRINKNVEEILRQSNDLYDKFVTFGETFVKIGKGIDNLKTDYNKAQSQLREGKGNIVKRLNGMKNLGITPKKQLPENLDE